MRCLPLAPVLLVATVGQARAQPTDAAPAAPGLAVDEGSIADAGTAEAGLVADGGGTEMVVLHGRVLERGARRALAGAAISIDGALVAESGPDGAFAAAVAPGWRRLAVSLPGFTPELRLVEVMAGERARTLSFSPDSHRLVWSDGVDDVVNLWMADGDGHNPVPLSVTAAIDEVWFSKFDGRLFFRRASRTGYGLAWLDLEAKPPRERPLAENIFGITERVSPRWLVQGTDYSARNGNGSLSLVNRDTGDTLALDTAVADYWVQRREPDDGSAPVRIVYRVQGREVSAHDGVWVMRLRTSDLP